MKFFISSFYNIRFFQSNQIPISTAMYDPKWFHNNTSDQSICFLDKNLVMNGIREETLSPAKIKAPCCPDCQYKSLLPNCPFLTQYRSYLTTVDFNYLLNEFARVADDVRKVTKYTGEPEIILLVHEAENNPCSERIPLQEYFKAHGYDLPNWSLANLGVVF